MEKGKAGDMILPDASDEQLSILTGLENGNIIVDSVAGSGKTTTNLYIGKKFADKKILLLTYNKKLKIETREKVNKLGIKNMEVHSYHSFCVKYYLRECYTDYGITDVIRNKNKPLQKFKYDIIILDEAQDICPLYYQLICKIIKDNEEKSKICLLGDKYQSIYQYNQADARFLEFGEKLFPNEFPWTYLTLSESFRVTKEIAQFVNSCLLKQTRLIAKKSGSRPRYIICDCFGHGSHNRPYQEIQYYFNKGYKYSDIFVLAPSVKSDKSPVRLLANLLSNQNIPVYVPISDDEKLDQDILDGKLVFSTFHQVKGLERKVVLVFGFDNSYFSFYKKNHNPSFCPNELYVATTRSLEHLSLLHHNKHDYLPFLSRSSLIYSFFESSKLSFSSISHKSSNILTVTDLIKHLPSSVIQHSLQFLDISIFHPKDSLINIPIKTKQNSLYESVSEITGTAIPAYFELINTGNMSIYEPFLNSTHNSISSSNISTHNSTDTLFNANFNDNNTDSKNDSIFNANFDDPDSGNSNTDSKNNSVFNANFDDPDSGNSNTDSKNDSVFNAKFDDPDSGDSGDSVFNAKFDEFDSGDSGDSVFNAKFDEFDSGDSVFNAKIDDKEKTKIKGKSIIDATKINLSKLTPCELLFLSNYWNCYKSGYVYKMNQITDYNWLSEKNLSLAVHRLQKYISPSSLFERKYFAFDQPELFDKYLLGYIDCIDHNIIWELKCVQQLENEHLLQLALYLYLFLSSKSSSLSLSSFSPHSPLSESDIIEYTFNHKVYQGIVSKIYRNGNINVKYDKSSPIHKITRLHIISNLSHPLSPSSHSLSDFSPSHPYVSYLFNILDGEIYQVKSSLSQLSQMVNFLISSKYYSTSTSSDSVFLSSNLSLRLKIIS